MRRGKFLVLVIGIAVAIAASAQRPRLLATNEVQLPVDTDTLQRQFDALSRMPSVAVKYSTRGNASFIRGNTGVRLQSVEHREMAREVLTKFKDVLLATGTEELSFSNDSSHRGYRDVSFTQTIRGIPVVRSDIVVRLDPKTSEVVEFAAGFIPGRGLPKTPKLTAAQAVERLTKDLETSGEAKEGTVVVEKEGRTLSYFGVFPDRRPQLVWELIVSYEKGLSEGSVGADKIWVDAIDGSVAGREPTHRAQIDLHKPINPNEGDSFFANTKNKITMPPMTEAQITADLVASKARENLVAVQGKWVELHNYPIDPLSRIVVRRNVGNAHFSRQEGIEYFIFKGPTTSTKSFGDVVDSVAHEYGHLVASGADYFKPFNQYIDSGGLDEGFGDLSAVFVDVAQKPLGSQLPDDNTWRSRKPCAMI